MDFPQSAQLAVIPRRGSGLGIGQRPYTLGCPQIEQVICVTIALFRAFLARMVHLREHRHIKPRSQIGKRTLTFDDLAHPI